MANIEVVKVEKKLNRRLLYSVRVNADRDHMEFPIGIQDQGSATANEAAVFTFDARLRGRTRGSGTAPVRSSNASLTV